MIRVINKTHKCDIVYYFDHCYTFLGFCNEDCVYKIILKDKLELEYNE